MNISSKNKKIVVFSDWHQESDKLRKILKHESDADFFVDCGDEFDSFDYDSDYDVQKAAELRKETLHDPKFTVLWGNHSVSYAFESNPYTKCSGYSQRKQQVINKVLGPNDYKKFKWFCWVDSFLCSHAGLHPYFLPPNIKLTKPALTAWLTKETEAASIALESGDSHWTFRAGRARGGIQRVGGLLWLDFDREFKSIDGLKTIQGHSPRQSGKIESSRDDPKGNNWCIDCFCNQWLVFEDGKMRIGEYKNL